MLMKWNPSPKSLKATELFVGVQISKAVINKKEKSYLENNEAFL